MIEIIVQVLPLMIRKGSDQKEFRKNFINNFINHSKKIIEQKTLTKIYESQKYNYLKENKVIKQLSGKIDQYEEI